MAYALLVDVGQRLDQGERAFAWRIDQPFVGHAVLHQHGGRHLEQIACHKLRGCQRGAVRIGRVGLVVAARAAYQGVAAFNAQHFARLRGNGQGEVAQAAKPVDDALVLLRIQPLQGTFDQHAVDVRIDLGEVGGPKRHGDAEFRQAVAQRRGIRADAVRRIRPLGLQPPLHARVLRSKSVQLVDIALRQRLQVPQHQRNGVVAAGQLDLRAGFARLQAGDERAQGQKQLADFGRQDGATAHIGDVAAFALVKTDEHFALFGHMAHRQARAPAVAPRRAMNGTQHGGGLAFAQVPEVVFQHALLDGDLRGRMQVLHFAAAASAGMQAEVGATRRHAQRRFLVHAGERGGLPIVFAAPFLNADPFARQCAINKHHFAIGVVGHALRFQIQRFHQQPIGLRMRRRRCGCGSPCRQAAPIGLCRRGGGFWLGFVDGGSHFGRLRAYQLSGQSNLMQSNGWHIKKRRLATALIIATHALLNGAGRAARPTPGRAWRAACNSPLSTHYQSTISAQAGS